MRRITLRRTVSYVGSYNRIIILLSSTSSSGEGASASSLPATGPIEILVNTTGLRVVEVKSGRKGRDPKTAAKRRAWRKLHLTMNAGSGRFVASELTTWRRADAAVLPDVMEQVDVRIDRSLADGAFDGHPPTTC